MALFCSTPPARFDSEDRPETLAGLPPQRRPALRIRRQRRRGEIRPRPLAVMSSSITTRIVHPPRKEDHETSRSDRSEPRPRPLTRTDRIHEHQKSVCSRESRSGSTAPNPSSPQHCSPSAATHHNSQTEPDPQIQQESDIWASWRASRLTSGGLTNGPGAPLGHTACDLAFRSA